MFRNYLKIAWRNLHRNPGYSLITVVGLAIGIAGALFVLLYLRDETGFDRFFEKSDRTFRVVETRIDGDAGREPVAFTSGALAQMLLETVPEVESTVRMVGGEAIGRRTASYMDRRFYEADYLLTEPSFFDVFGDNLLQGNSATALTEPRSVVLTETSAEKYFGDLDPMGKTLSMEQFGDLRVSGIVRDPQANSHLDYSMLISLATANIDDRWAAWLESWNNDVIIVYATLTPEADPSAVQRKMETSAAGHFDVGADARVPYLQPIADIHFGSGQIVAERNAREGDPRYLYIFAAIGLFLVLIASINYMNMTTARSMRRAREIGMRKVAGGMRGQLVRQFLTESILTTVGAAALAVGIVGTLLPLFNDISGKNLSTQSLFTPEFIAMSLGLCFIVGIVSGSYPALFLSRLTPAEIMTGGADGGPQSAARLRKGLVVAQFVLSIMLISATLVVYQQMEFVQSRPLGFNQDRLVVVDINSGDVRANWQTVRDEMAKIPTVRSVSTSSRVPGDWKGIVQTGVRAEGSSSERSTTVHLIGVDESFLSTFEIPLVSGREFRSGEIDSNAVILNQTAAKALGIVTPELQWLEFPVSGFRAQVVGIVEDFNFESLHSRVGPMVLAHWSNPIQAIDYFTVRVSSAGTSSVIDGLREVGETFDPGHPFEYNVLEQRLGDFYRTERRAGTLFGLAAALSIFIACLGLAGLAAYTAERRTKEIGVRKVLGATVRGIVLLLSKDFVVLVALAFLIATPMSYVLMDRWLDGFAYRTDLALGVFTVSGAIALIIALLTVSFQAVRSALANPVDALRYE